MVQLNLNYPVILILNFNKIYLLLYLGLLIETKLLYVGWKDSGTCSDEMSDIWKHPKPWK